MTLAMGREPGWMVSEKVPILAQAGTELQESPPGRGEGDFR